MIRPQVGSRYLFIFYQSIFVPPTHFAISVVLHLICCRPNISSAAVSVPVFLHLRHHAPLPLYSPLNLSAIPIILHLHHTYIVILPHLCCGPYHIIFYRYVYFAAVICPPSPIGSSPHSASFCTTLIAPLCSTLLFTI